MQDSKRKTRVLVVEDEAIIAHDIRGSLEGYGYEVVAMCMSGEDALSSIKDTAPDIVLMDIVIQGDFDGIATAQEVRDRFNLPVIYLTAFADESVLARAKVTNPFGYIVKPFESRELNFTIQMALYKHSLDRQLEISRAQYQRLVEVSGAIPWEMRASDMTYTYVGPQVKEVLGLGPEELSGLAVLEGMMHAEDRERAGGFYRRASEGMRADEIEYRLRTHDGRDIWVTDTVTFDPVSEGAMIRGFMLDVTIKKEAALERERHIAELQDALDRINALQGLLPICAWCKKIRDDKGYWKQVELYIEEHSRAEFTHSMCPDCQKAMEEELSRYKDSANGGK